MQSQLIDQAIFLRTKLVSRGYLGRGPPPEQYRQPRHGGFAEDVFVEHLRRTLLED